MTVSNLSAPYIRRLSRHDRSSHPAFQRLSAGLAAGAALAATPALAARAAKAPAPVDPKFPAGFLWGAATAGHQVEGNNVNADVWLAEHVTPTAYAEPSGDAANSFALWRTDLDLVKGLGSIPIGSAWNGRGSSPNPGSSRGRC